MSLPRSCGGSAHASAQTLLLLTPAVVNCPCLEDFLASLVDPVKDGRKESEQERKREREREGICPPWAWQPESLAVPWAQGLLPQQPVRKRMLNSGFPNVLIAPAPWQPGSSVFPSGQPVNQERILRNVGVALF